MKHICATLLLLCTPEITLENKFVNKVKECALEYNSMVEEQNRIPIILVLAQAVQESNWGKSRFAIQGNNLFGVRAVNGEDYIDLLLTSKHYKKFQKELINQWFTDTIEVNKLVDTLDLYAEDVYYKDKIKDVIKYVKRRLQ